MQFWRRPFEVNIAKRLFRLIDLVRHPRPSVEAVVVAARPKRRRPDTKVVALLVARRAWEEPLLVPHTPKLTSQFVFNLSSPVYAIN